MKFSQRIGKTPVKTILQVESIDEELKNRLWNVVREEFFNQFSDPHDEYSQIGEVCARIWKDFFGETIDTIPSYGRTISVESFILTLKDWFYHAKWYEIYDLIEFIVEIDKEILLGDISNFFNKALEKEVAAYRIVSYQVVQITSESEIEEIEKAINETDKWKPVNDHLQTALNFLSNKKNPDFRNSIKESISSVESLCKIITKDKNTTLGKALIEIEKKFPIHGAMKNSFTALYGFTSDAGGIRHSLLEKDVEIDFADAKYMLVSCSAFINYLKVKLQL
jgi:hypothetical protein